MEKISVKAQHFLQAVHYTLGLYAIPIVPRGTLSPAIFILRVPVGTLSTGNSEDTTP